MSTPREVRAALDAFRHIVRALRENSMERTGSPLGSAQLFALQQIAEHPDASVNDVAALTFTHQSSVSVVIQRLVEQGFVMKVSSDEDRRRHRLAVTASGHRVLRRTPAAAQSRLIAALASLPSAERKAFARTMTTVAQAVSPHGAASHPPMFFEDQQDTRASIARRTAKP